MRKGIPLLLLLALALSACGMARFGRDFDLQNFESKIERGTSKTTDVRGWLGEPVSVGTTVDSNGERFEEWTYYYGETRLPNGADSFLKILQIKFDRTGVVRAYNWSGEPRK
jgi:hypothetical protein